MSICANLYVLFRVTPTAERVKQIEASITSMLGHRPWTMNRWDNDADRFLTPRDTDSLDFTQQGSITTRQYDRSYMGLPGPVDSSRFYEISYLSRWWSESYPDGPMQEYGKTMLHLLNQPNVEHVWFAPDDFSQLDPMTSADVGRMMARAAELADIEST